MELQLISSDICFVRDTFESYAVVFLSFRTFGEPTPGAILPASPLLPRPGRLCPCFRSSFGTCCFRGRISLRSWSWRWLLISGSTSCQCAANLRSLARLSFQAFRLCRGRNTIVALHYLCLLGRCSTHKNRGDLNFDLESCPVDCCLAVYVRQLDHGPLYCTVILLQTSRRVLYNRKNSILREPNYEVSGNFTSPCKQFRQFIDTLILQVPRKYPWCMRRFDRARWVDVEHRRILDLARVGFSQYVFASSLRCIKLRMIVRAPVPDLKRLSYFQVIDDFSDC